MSAESKIAVVDLTGEGQDALTGRLFEGSRIIALFCLHPACPHGVFQFLQAGAVVENERLVAAALDVRTLEGVRPGDSQPVAEVKSQLVVQFDQHVGESHHPYGVIVVSGRPLVIMHEGPDKRLHDRFRALVSQLA